MIKFIKSAASVQDCPAINQKEICFIGRSNVGKSSLLNAITNSKIARVAKSPGRTRLLNFFQFNDLIMVDLPGYGYAKIDKKAFNKMNYLVEEYFLYRQNLHQVFLLIDAKIGITDLDYKMIKFLQSQSHNFFLIITKNDKTNQAQRHFVKDQVEKITGNFLFVSSLKKHNIDKLISKINAIKK